jgi:hypothetical protein
MQQVWIETSECYSVMEGLRDVKSTLRWAAFQFERESKMSTGSYCVNAICIPKETELLICREFLTRLISYEKCGEYEG